MMAKAKLDAAIADLTQKSDHKTLAIWAADCAERVLPYFEAKYPQDHRLRAAIEAVRSWVNENLAMIDARKAAFAAHAAARDAEQIPEAQAAARAAGHAAATAHVATHAIHAANYALKAIQHAIQDDTTAIMDQERQWQYKHLLELNEN
ncbi:hypothetical protein MASR2M15_06500 [Anaerolineales bacterium]